MCIRDRGDVMAISASLQENIFPSIPKKKDLLIIPVLVDLQLDQILLFNNNIFYDINKIKLKK